jgi:hypothetical protein
MQARRREAGIDWNGRPLAQILRIYRLAICLGALAPKPGGPCGTERLVTSPLRRDVSATALLPHPGLTTIFKRKTCM